MTKRRKFLVEDGISIERPEKYRWIVEHPLYEQWLAINYRHGPGYTVTDGKKVIVCAGVRVLWEGTGEAWLMFTHDVRDYMHVHLEVIDILQCIVADEGLDRVQAHVTSDHDEDVRYIEWLGLVREGLCRKYGPCGKDAYMYAKVRD
jgi:hypothetical protein